MAFSRFVPSAAVILTLACLAARAEVMGTPLFNGKDLAGWEGDLKAWRVEDGAITRGEVDQKIDKNDFLTTTKSYQNFDLRLKIKLTGTEGFVNSGIQFRSVRVPNHHEMSGYQADAGAGWWGALYDETRRNTVISKVIDPAALKAALKVNDWNDYRIRAEGPHIELWINGVKTVDYTEKDPNVAGDGLIGLQLHGGAKAKVQFKDLVIEELPPTPDAPTWEKLGGYKPWPKKK